MTSWMMSKVLFKDVKLTSTKRFFMVFNKACNYPSDHRLGFISSGLFPFGFHQCCATSSCSGRESRRTSCSRLLEASTVTPNTLRQTTQLNRQNTEPITQTKTSLQQRCTGGFQKKKRWKKMKKVSSNYLLSLFIYFYFIYFLPKTIIIINTIISDKSLKT